jgi:sigma-B regulation protein RsbU (phosphoserine phosphatase)
MPFLSMPFLDAMDRPFQPFHRIPAPDSRQILQQASQQGLGLGLYIVSEIARAHGGKIEVASSAHKTRFTFRMPL